MSTCSVLDNVNFFFKPHLLPNAPFTQPFVALSHHCRGTSSHAKLRKISAVYLWHELTVNVYVPAAVTVLGTIKSQPFPELVSPRTLWLSVVREISPKCPFTITSLLYWLVNAVCIFFLLSFLLCNFRNYCIQFTEAKGQTCPVSSRWMEIPPGDSTEECVVTDAAACWLYLVTARWLIFKMLFRCCSGVMRHKMDVWMRPCSIC